MAPNCMARNRKAMFYITLQLRRTLLDKVQVSSKFRNTSDHHVSRGELLSYLKDTVECRILDNLCMGLNPLLY